MSAASEIVQIKGFDIEVIRTARKKTASLKVVEGHISVVVPQKTRIDTITTLISRKNRWIREKLRQQKDHKPVKPKEYVSGESFSYLGRNYRLKVGAGDKKEVKLIGGRLIVAVPPIVKHRERYIREALVDWYRTHALTKLTEKVQRYPNVLGVSPSTIDVKEFKARWGSCSRAGNMIFNWRIITAPNAIVDYVVVHELCHLKHHDHSPEFWKCVERVLPDYAESKEWLKANGVGLTV